MQCESEEEEFNPPPRTTSTTSSSVVLVPPRGPCHRVVVLHMMPQAYATVILLYFTVVLRVVLAPTGPVRLRAYYVLHSICKLVVRTIIRYVQYHS